MLAMDSVLESVMELRQLLLAVVSVVVVEVELVVRQLLLVVVVEAVEVVVKEMAWREMAMGLVTEVKCRQLLELVMEARHRWHPCSDPEAWSVNHEFAKAGFVV